MDRFKKHFFCLILLLAFSTSPANALFQLDIETAIQLFESGDLLSAKSIFEMFHETSPEDHRAAFYLGRINYNECQMNEAVSWFKKAAKGEKSNSAYHLWLGRAYARKGIKASFIKKPFYAGKARKNLLKAVELDPTNTIAHHDLIQYYMLVPGILGGGKKKAVNHAMQLNAQNPWEGFKAFGQIHLLEKEYEAAAMVYQEAIIKYPTEIQFYLALVNAYLKAGEYQRALAVCEDIARAIPEKKIDALYIEGTIFLEMEDYQQAFLTFEEVIFKHFDYLEAYAGIGKAALALEQQIDYAIACLNHYVKFYPAVCHPDLAAAHYNLGKLYKMQGDPLTAIQEFDNALELNPRFKAAEREIKNLE